MLAAVTWSAVACRPVEDEPHAERRTVVGAQALTPSGAQAETTTAADTNLDATLGSASTRVGLPDFATLAERLAPSVVAVVSTVEASDEGGGPRVVRGIGSGVVVSARGQVLTNEHVVASASKVHVELVTHERIAASVVFADPRLDLALLQLDTEVEGLTPVELRAAPARPGEWVMAVGQPYGLGHTVTVGVVSGLGRDYVDLGRPKGLESDGIWSFIQTDASINIGNSGGPLVDVEGRVVGITTAVRSDGQGLAFAIPSAMARHFLHEVWTYGRVRHPRLGLRAEDAEAGTLPGRGAVVRITGVDDGGPSANAGLAAGDIILAVDGHAVTRVSQVAYWAELAGVGADVDLTVVGGDGQAKIVTLRTSQAR